jgi:hypothetical protein
MNARLVSTAALAAMILALATPAWPCGPASGMGGNNQGGNAAQGGASPGSGGGAGGLTTGASSDGGGWNNSDGGERERQEAANPAASDLEGGDAGPRRSAGGGDGQHSADYSSQIQALGQATAQDAAAPAKDDGLDMMGNPVPPPLSDAELQAIEERTKATEERIWALKDAIARQAAQDAEAARLAKEVGWDGDTHNLNPDWLTWYGLPWWSRMFDADEPPMLKDLVYPTPPPRPGNGSKADGRQG